MPQSEEADYFLCQLPSSRAKLKWFPPFLAAARRLNCVIHFKCQQLFKIYAKFKKRTARNVLRLILSGSPNGSMSQLTEKVSELCYMD